MKRKKGVVVPDFGKRLKEWRSLKNLSQAALAERAGVSRQIIQAYESKGGAAHSPTLVMLEKLALAVGLDVCQFLVGPDQTVMIDGTPQEQPGQAIDDLDVHPVVWVPQLKRFPKEISDLKKPDAVYPAAEEDYDRAGVNGPDGVAMPAPTDEMYPLIRAGAQMGVIPTEKPRSQDVVVGRYKGRPFVRRYIVRDRQVFLEASNMNFPDIEVNSPKDVVFFGKVLMAKIYFD